MKKRERFATFISPAVMIISIILIFVATIRPLAPHYISLLTVTDPAKKSTVVWMGLFGSCERKNSSEVISCGSTYLFSSLSPNAPTFVLEAPPRFLKALGVVSPSVLGLINLISVIRTFLWCRYDHRGRVLKYQLVAMPWLASLACFIGISNILALQTYINKACYNFNLFMKPLQQVGDPDLIAFRGDSFKLAYSGYALFLLLALVGFLVDPKVQARIPVGT